MNVGHGATEPSITTQNYASSGGETTGAAYDLVDNRNTKVITIDTSGESGPWTVDLDTSANIVAANFSILDNHNLATAGADIKQTYSNGSLQALTAAYGGTLGSALAAETVASNQVIEPTDGILLFDFNGTRTHNNWELEVEEDGATFDADVTMGEYIIGVSFTPSFSPELNLGHSYAHPGVNVVQASGGPKYGFSTYDDTVNSWTMNWKYMSDADKVLLKVVYDITVGGKYPFYIDLGESATPHLYRVRFTSEPKFTQLTADAWGVSVSIAEEL